jgi:hypothetical protein
MDDCTEADAMKLWRPVVAAVVAAGLFGLYTWDLRATEMAALREQRRQRVLFVKPELVARVTFEEGERRAVVERTAGGLWLMTEPEKRPANDDIVEAFLENLRGARRQAELEEGAARAVDFGSSPRRVVIEYRDEETGQPMRRTLEFAPVADQDAPRVHARLAEEPGVFTVSDWLYRQAGKGPGELRSNRVVAGQAAEWDRLEIATRRGAESFALVRDPADSTRWNVAMADGRTLPADRTIVDRLLGNLTSMRFGSVADQVTSTAVELGLAPPVAEVRSAGGPLLAVGMAIPGKEVLVARGQDGTIGTIPAGVVADLFRSPMEWGSKRFVWFDRSAMEEIRVSAASSQFTLLREGGRWIFAEMPGVPVRQDSVDSLVEGLLGFTAIRLLATNVSDEDARARGILPETYKLIVRSPSGEEQGFHFGRTDTREGNTFVLRLQDRTLWAISFRQQHTVYRNRRELEERRIAPDLAARTTYFEIETPHAAAQFRRTGAAWQVTIPGEKPTLMRPLLVTGFLEAFQALESESEMLTPTEIPPEITFRFFEREGGPLVLRAGVVSRSRTTGNTYFGVEGRMLEVPASQVEAMDQALTDLLIGAKADAEGMRTGLKK